jgi:signal transduction histidine kinase/ActR/RegA family two-component response regulator
MEKIRAKIQCSFSTKVLLPMVGTMVLLMALTVWLVDRRIAQQFQREAAASLATAEAVFRNSRELQTKELLLRYRHLPNEPRYKAAFQAADPPTLRDLLSDLLGEQTADVILFTTDKPELLASSKRDPLTSTSDFESGSAPAVAQALRGEEKADTIRVGGRLFDVVSIPVFGTSGYLIGALTLGSEISDAVAQRFSRVTQSQIILVANGRVIASTLPTPGLQPQLARLFNECLAATGPRGDLKGVPLGNEHYFCSAGRFDSLSGDDRLGYLLLSSYEKPWRDLQSTHQMLLAVSASGILLGIAVVWFMVRRTTQPLRSLSASVEAVGRGDFSQRVHIVSQDEIGELACAFNRMTENLERSRSQLERTIETLKTTQAQLIQSEKLSGIGEFVAGIAHELNNPLTSVMGFSELLKQSAADPQHQRQLDLIHKSALRCQKIVQSLLSFARRHQAERKLSSLNELITGAVEFLQYQLRTSNIEVVTKLDSDLPKTMVDPHQLQQVFLNIINNARQAIEGHHPKGCVRIGTQTCGQHLRVVIQDDGPGISDQNLSKVFDPFFTTKEVGKGTGLGLSLCYGIIKEHGGAISVRSKPGEGATFIIDLPLVRGAGEAPHESGTDQILPPRPQRQGAPKKILVIDDEEAILQMVRDTLSSHGYEVDGVTDGDAALRRLTQIRYDLALCDLKMPGLNGQQVYEQIRASYPALSERMIFITGDVINENAQRFLQQRKKVCLSKPFSLAEFRTAVDRALASRTGSDGNGQTVVAC